MSNIFMATLGEQKNTYDEKMEMIMRVHVNQNKVFRGQTPSRKEYDFFEIEDEENNPFLRILKKNQEGFVSSVVDQMQPRIDKMKELIREVEIKIEKDIHG